MIDLNERAVELANEADPRNLPKLARLAMAEALRWGADRTWELWSIHSTTALNEAKRLEREALKSKP